MKRMAIVLVVVLMLVLPVAVYACESLEHDACEGGSLGVSATSGQWVTVWLVDAYGNVHPYADDNTWVLTEGSGLGICGNDPVYVDYGDSYQVPCDISDQEVALTWYGSGWPCDGPEGGPAIRIVSICDSTPLDYGNEVRYEWFDSGCVEAESSCVTSNSSVFLYANGLRIGACGDDPAQFAARPVMSNTLVMLADEDFALYGLDVQCTKYLTASEATTVTVELVEPHAITPTSTGAMVLSGNGGFMGLRMGGDLNDPGSPINVWLGYAMDVVNLVNQGNLLYIVGGIMSAALVLKWAIDQVRNPSMWS